MSQRMFEQQQDNSDLSLGDMAQSVKVLCHDSERAVNMVAIKDPEMGAEAATALKELNSSTTIALNAKSTNISQADMKGFFDKQHTDVKYDNEVDVQQRHGVAPAA